MFSSMSRLGLLATLSALILTGCVTSYTYRDGPGGDYYYAEPRVEHYDVYGYPYGSIGYGYPAGWYGHFGFGFGYMPYSRYGFPYGAFGYRSGYPYGFYPYWRYTHRPPRHRPPGGHGPGNGPGNGPGGGPRFTDNEGGPWRNLDRFRNREHRPQNPGGGNTPGGGVQNPRPPVSLQGGTPVRRPRIEAPRPSIDAPRPRPAMPARTERPERAFRRGEEP
jgi:hypothetical protein